MRKLISISFFLTVTFVFIACKKELTSQSQNGQYQLGLNSKATTTSNLSSSTCRDELQPDWYADTIDVATQLGGALSGNPYSVSVMRQAAVNLYGTNQGITANRKYIRYKPSTLDQLDSLMNSDIELFDYPLDRDVIEEGDYYPQAGIGDNEIPWFYSVVDISYQPMPGIQYEELAQVYVPDDDLSLENEAFRITGNPVENLDCSSGPILSSKTSGDITPDGTVCPQGYHLDPDTRQCVPDACPEGYHWNGTACVPDPPPPPPVSKQPTGQILVRDFKNISGGYQDVPVRRTKVVLRRFLKIDRVYTDDQGNFFSTKHFHNKVNVFVKFKSTQLTTRALRGARAWQALFPIQHGLGKYSGDLRNINWTFTSAQSGNSRANRNWWSAQVMNAYLEFNENASALGIGTLPTDMRFLITAWHAASGSGSTPMNHHRNAFELSSAYIQQFLVQPAGAYWGQVYNNAFNANGIVRGMDMSLGYNTPDVWTSDRVKQLMYHEMGHASHFAKVGENWWNDLVYAEAYEISRFGANGFNSPYGAGDDGILSDHISLAESWAEHVGQTIADRVYGFNSTSFVGQRTTTYSNDWPVAGLSSHLNYLEDFDPNNPGNPFRWIPDGLYYDLSDTRNEFPFPVADNVLGFTNTQLFNALQSDVTSVPQYRERLITQNPNNQATEVRNLFNQYHY